MLIECKYYRKCQQDSITAWRRSPEKCNELLGYGSTHCHIPKLLNQCKVLLNRLEHSENLDQFDIVEYIRMLSWFIKVIEYNMRHERK